MYATGSHQGNLIATQNRKENHSLVRIQTCFIFKRFLYV